MVYFIYVISNFKKLRIMILMLSWQWTKMDVLKKGYDICFYPTPLRQWPNTDMKKVKKFPQAGFWNHEIFAEISISTSQQKHKCSKY